MKLLVTREEDDGQGGGSKTFTDIASEAFDAGRFGNSGLTFDLSQFKAKKVVSGLHCLCIHTQRIGLYHQFYIDLCPSSPYLNSTVI